MGLFYNGANVSPTNNVFINSQAAKKVIYNGVEVWKKAFNILAIGSWPTLSQTVDGAGTPDNYGGAGRNPDGSVWCSAFNGGRAGWAHWTFGPFSTRGFSHLNLYAAVTVTPGANGVRVGNFYVKLVDAGGNDVQWIKNDNVPPLPGTYDGIVAEVGQYDNVYLRVGVQGTATGQGGTTTATIGRLLLQ